jgi:hypothetical protein
MREFRAFRPFAWAGPATVGVVRFTIALIGTPRVGEVLTVADFASYDAVQFTRNGTPIEGAMGETFALTAVDDQSVIRVEGTRME